jgi:structural maintenance of chromosome 4
MDEIDAALDFKNVSIVGNYIQQRTRNAQFIIISLRNNMFELADRLVGIYKTQETTKSVTINPYIYEKNKQQQENKNNKNKKTIKTTTFSTNTTIPTTTTKTTTKTAKTMMTSTDSSTTSITSTNGLVVLQDRTNHLS